MIDQIALYFLTGVMAGFLVPCTYILFKTVRSLENKITKLQNMIELHAVDSFFDKNKLLQKLKKQQKANNEKVNNYYDNCCNRSAEFMCNNT